MSHVQSNAGDASYCIEADVRLTLRFGVFLVYQGRF